MIITAGVTHVLTRASYDPTMTASVSGSIARARRDSVEPGPSGQPVQRVAEAPAAEQREPEPTASTPGSTSGSARQRTPAREASVRAPRGGGSGSGRSADGTARLASTDPLREAEPVYDREIGKLRAIVRERRSQLDPKTVAVLEQSIAVIDSAIAQSRAALAKDPASGFLATQLNHSLEKKVELLRTAALLPART
jgi:hypothetical protein